MIWNLDSYIRKANDILNYDEEFEQGDEPSNVDLLSELGELSNDLEMTKGDMEKVVSSDKIKNDVDGLVKIILDEYDEFDSEKEETSKLEKVVVWYACMNNGDGSVGLTWYLSSEEAEEAESSQDEGWGESCIASVETFVGSDIHRKAQLPNSEK